MALIFLGVMAVIFFVIALRSGYQSHILMPLLQGLTFTLLAVALFLSLLKGKIILGTFMGVITLGAIFIHCVKTKDPKA